MEWLYAKGIPIEAQYLYRKAHEMAGLGKYESALNYYRQALIIAPKYVQALFEMGNSYARLNRYPEALDMYNRAIRLDPKSEEIQKRKEDLVRLSEKKFE